MHMIAYNMMCLCRHWYQYLDFLHYAWYAQMINQFENTEIFIFLNLEVTSIHSCSDLSGCPTAPFHIVPIPCHLELDRGHA